MQDIVAASLQCFSPVHFHFVHVCAFQNSLNLRCDLPIERGLIKSFAQQYIYAALNGHLFAIKETVQSFWGMGGGGVI